MNKNFSKIFLSVLLVISMILVVTACTNDGDSSSTVEDYPTKPITVINPYKAGGSGDTEVRAMQPALEKLFGKSIVTEYITTGGGTYALEKFANMDADGYSLLYINNPAAIINELTEDVKYNVLEDFDYLINVVTEYRVVATLESSGITSVEDIIERSKSGEELSIAHSGIGSSGHLQITLLEKAMDINFNDVPFEGNSPAKAAFLGGHVDLWAIDAVSVLPLVESGEVRVIGINAPERHKELPDVPTFKELGYDEVEVSTSRGFIAPKGLDEDVKEKIISVLKDAIKSDEMQRHVESSKSSINDITGEEYYKFTEGIYNNIAPIADLFK